MRPGRRRRAMYLIVLAVLVALVVSVGLVGVVAADATAPTFNNGSSHTVSIDEDSTPGDVQDVDAADDYGTNYDTNVTYSLGGVDAGLFSIDTANGQLTLDTPLDYDDPSDIDTDNDYELRVTATDDNGNTATHRLTVTVTSGPPICSAVSYTGNGTSGDPYEVGTLDQLQCMGSDNANESQSGALSSDYKLVSDIDASATPQWNGGEGFEPIGSCSAFRSNQNDMCRDNSDGFSGVFDGNGNAITDVVINRPDGNSVGLFGYTNDATVRNIRLQNATVRADQRVGGLIGAQLFGVVENVSVDGQVEGGIVSPGNDPDGFRVGGIVGMGIRGAVLTNQNVFTGNVTGGSNVGGIIGRTGGSTAVSVAYSRANVTATADRCTVCTNTNSPGGPNAGGIAGNSGNPSDIENSYAAGTVTGSIVGGIVGGDNSGTDTFVNVYWDSDLGPGQGTGADYSSSTTNFTGLTTAEMQGDAADTNMGGFDFDTQWGAPTASYPIFQWQLGVADDPDGFFFGDITAVAGNGQIVVSATDGGVGVPGETIVVLDGGDIDSLDGLSAGDTATTDENGDATFSFTEETAGTYVIAVETEDGQASDTAEVVVEAAAPSDEGNGEFTATIDGTLGEQGTANVTVRDEFGNPAVGETIAVTDADGLSTIPASATVGSGGNATFSFDVVDRGSYTPTFGLQGGSLSDTATFTTTCDVVAYETVDGVKQVDSAATLQCMDADLDADYELTEDIDLSAASVDSWDGGTGFSPVGNASHPFTGSFDGGDHTISNLTINRSATSDIGLFGATAGSGLVTRTHLLNASVDGDQRVGGLVGDNAGTVTRSSVAGNVTGAGTNTGGLAGGSAGTVNRSYASVNVTSTADYVGGLIGENTGTVNTSYALGTVTAGSSQYVGGLIGQSEGTVNRSYATGAISGASDVGGLIGNSTGTVGKAYWDEDATGLGSSDGGTKLSTSQMQGTSASMTMSDLDFANTWETVVQGGDASADGYPILRTLDRRLQLEVQDIYDPPPMVDSVTRASTSPTDAESVDFTVAFSETVTGVDKTDFTLTTTGSATTTNGDADISVSGTGSSYTVTVTNVSGTGDLRLDVKDDDTINATNGVALAGTYPATDGSYTSGESYTVDNAGPTLNDDTGSTAETTRIQIIDDLTANDTDDTALSVSKVDGSAGNLGSETTGSNGGRFTITSDGTVTFDPDGDFETLTTGESATSEVTVIVADALGNADTQTVTARVDGVNDAPIGIGLSSASVAQSSGTDASVGSLSATDVDSDTVTYSLVSGTGDANNSAFSIDSGTLRAVDAGTLAEGDYTVRIEANDGTGGTFERAFDISVTDDVAPTITATTPTDGATSVDETSDITITFSENVSFGKGNITLREDDGGFTDAETFNVSSDTGSDDGNVSVTGDTLRINATDDFAQRSYAVRIESGALVDTASTPNDFGGISDDSTLNFTSADTVAPTANQGGARTVDEDAEVTFDAGSSTDNVGISSYDWDFDDDGATASGETSTHTFSMPGTYDVSLTVEDAAGNTDSQTVTITVDAVNDAPTDIALSSSTVAQSSGADASVGSLSITDEDDTTATYSLVSGAGDDDNDHFRISSGSLLATDAAVLDSGNYSVRIEADDGNGGTVEESFTILVSDDVAPTADAGPDQTVANGTAVQFDGSGSTDSVGITSHAWDVDDDGTTDLNGKQPSYTYAQPGTYTVRLTASDAAGNNATDTLTVTVQDVTAPSISAYSVSNPSSGEVKVSFESSESLGTITANISGAESATLTQSDFAEAGSGPYTYTATYEASTDGTYDVTLNTANDSADNNGASGQSQSVAVDVGGGDSGGSSGGGGSSTDDDDEDRDGDGIEDDTEESLGLSPTETDSDDDGISDATETTTRDGTGPGEAVDTDGDGTIDALDTDSDGDGVPDSTEGTADVNDNGIPDYRDADYPIGTLSAPSTLAFDDTVLGATDTKSVELSNDGSAAVSLDEVTISGPGADSYSVSTAGLSGSEIAPRDSETISVSFSPTSVEPATATLRITSSDGDIEQTALTGTAQSDVGVSDDALGFGNVTVGESVTRSVTVSVIDEAPGPVTITEADLVGRDADQFNLGESPPITLQPGESRELPVTLTPTSPGGKLAALRLVWDTTDNAQLDVSLSNIETVIVVRPGVADADQPEVNIEGKNVAADTQAEIDVSVPRTRERDVTITGLRFRTRVAGNFTMDLTQSDSPATDTSPAFESTAGEAQTVIEHARLIHSITNEEMNETMVTFRVQRDVLDGDGATAEDVTFHRYSGEEWAAMPTWLVRTTDSHYHYESPTPGFSEFAVTTPGQTVETTDETDSPDTSDPDATGTATQEPAASGDDSGTSSTDSDTTSLSSRIVSASWWVVILVGLLLVVILLRRKRTT